MAIITAVLLVFLVLLVHPRLKPQLHEHRPRESNGRISVLRPLADAALRLSSRGDDDRAPHAVRRPPRALQGVSCYRLALTGTPQDGAWKREPGIEKEHFQVENHRHSRTAHGSNLENVFLCTANAVTQEERGRQEIFSAFVICTAKQSIVETSPCVKEARQPLTAPEPRYLLRLKYSPGTPPPLAAHKSIRPKRCPSACIHCPLTRNHDCMP